MVTQLKPGEGIKRGAACLKCFWQPLESKIKPLLRLLNSIAPCPSPLKERGITGVRLINNLLLTSSDGV